MLDMNGHLWPWEISIPNLPNWWPPNTGWHNKVKTEATRNNSIQKKLESTNHLGNLGQQITYETWVNKK